MLVQILSINSNLYIWGKNLEVTIPLIWIDHSLFQAVGQGPYTVKSKAFHSDGEVERIGGWLEKHPKLQTSRWWTEKANYQKWHIGCTWLGRDAFWSADRRAKSTILASDSKSATRSPSPLSITLNPDVVQSWWARRNNRLVNSCIMSVLTIYSWSTWPISEKKTVTITFFPCM